MNGGFQPIAYDPAFQQVADDAAFQCIAFQPFAFQNDCETQQSRVIPPYGGYAPFYLERLKDDEEQPEKVAEAPKSVYASQIAEFKMPPLRVDFRAPKVSRMISPPERVEVSTPDVVDKPKRSKARLALIAMQLFED